jgi:hypothetical protein
MKHYILSAIVFNLLIVAQNNSIATLPLLKVNDVFNPAILNTAVKSALYSSDIIMLRIRKIKPIKTENDNYALSVATLDLDAFKYFKFHTDKYFGYFEYQGHTVLVYGDDNIGYFFSQMTTTKYFYFLAYKPYDTDKNPPVSIEPDVYIYRYANGKFTMTNAGMFSFGE